MHYHDFSRHIATMKLVHYIERYEPALARMPSHNET